MKKYDLIIVGGGASGLMAGVLAKDKGLNFLIIEKNERVGMKLGITGKGRCNLSNYITDLDTLVSKYTHNGKFLYHAFSEFNPVDTKKFFEERMNIPLKIERGDRVFPKSDRSLDVVNTFYNELEENILLNTEVKGIEEKDGRITKVITDNEECIADNYILATGGKTYPLTGSTGDGYSFAKSLGHTINYTYPVLVGFKCKEDFVEELAGLTLKHVNISVLKDGEVYKEEFGNAMFTHGGISGPTILNLSQYTYDMYEDGFEISIDLKPRVEFNELDARVNKLLRENGTTSLKNILKELLPSSLIPVFIKIINLDPYITGAEINKDQRSVLVSTLKDLRLHVIDSEGYQRAVVNTGGIDIKEVNPMTMRSKIIENLYFTGDILDLFGPTGGYNLQIAWSTAFVAVNSLT
ncbi:MAG: NAD(FAD)-utilizing dehydrogenase [candidate division WS6 bacterium 34_10]|uniref:NAD(FAD)-utilizing dehydrogenase n=1 Tax=candidate division WS6 bacterium 34_10 TaxID=1641389 RepID=A0A117M0M1_9BACT|nr:MAG: NAD(FAD)-utilizing dehydrogenase [candidate division WS6 bacterium 34_10]